MESFSKTVSVLDSEFIDLDPISLRLTHEPAGKGELHNCKRLPEEKNTQTVSFRGNGGMQTDRDGKEKQQDKKLKVRKREKISGRLWSVDK